jgi:cell migration-inducing and hyaluronan-binding protein
MGQADVLAAYPVHWHGVGDGGGQFIRNSTVWRSYSRCISIHCTDNVQVGLPRCAGH